MRKLIEALVPALKDINHIFNGLQCYDHKRVVEICALALHDSGWSMNYVIVVRGANEKIFDFDDATQMSELVSSIVRKFQDYVEIDQDYACPWGTIPKSRKTGAILDKERYFDWYERDHGFMGINSDRRREVMADIDQVYASAAP